MASGSRGRGRGRQRKVPKGGSRMDAAVDAMRPYGFSDYLIVKTMKELLNIYTDEGWHLIEELSYAVLREALLEKTAEESTVMGDECFEHGSGSGSDTIAAGSSNEALVPAPAGMEIDTCESQVIETTSPLFHVNDVPDPSNMEIISVESQVTETIDTSSQTIHFPGESKCTSPPRFFNFPERLNTLPTRTRRPYHGWVSRNNDEKPALVYLTPAPLPKVLKELFHKNRKRRWDVKAEVMQSV